VKAGKENANVSSWKRIQPGDVVLFSGDRLIRAAGVVVEKTSAPSLAAALWGRDAEDHSSWDHVYLLEDVQLINISVPEFNRMVGYQENLDIRGFTVMDETRSARFLDAFERFSDAHPAPVTPQKYARLVRNANFVPGEPTDATGLRKFRKEQQALRSLLFGDNDYATCALSGNSYPVNFLVATHVKPRAFCDEQERMDWEHIVMPACKFGCDELYEQGYIAVENGGEIVVRHNMRRTPEIERYIAQFAQKKCSHWSAASEPYFAWRRARDVKLNIG
jgi:hypothetical protein